MNADRPRQPTNKNCYRLSRVSWVLRKLPVKFLILFHCWLCVKQLHVQVILMTAPDVSLISAYMCGSIITRCILSNIKVTAALITRGRLLFCYLVVTCNVFFKKNTITRLIISKVVNSFYEYSEIGIFEDSTTLWYDNLWSSVNVLSFNNIELQSIVLMVYLIQTIVRSIRGRLESSPENSLKQDFVKIKRMSLESMTEGRCHVIRQVVPRP